MSESKVSKADDLNRLAAVIVVYSYFEFVKISLYMLAFPWFFRFCQLTLLFTFHRLDSPVNNPASLWFGGDFKIIGLGLACIYYAVMIILGTSAGGIPFWVADYVYRILLQGAFSTIFPGKGRYLVQNFEPREHCEYIQGSSELNFHKVKANPVLNFLLGNSQIYLRVSAVIMTLVFYSTIQNFLYESLPLGLRYISPMTWIKG